MNIYWSPSIQIGAAAILIFWISYFRWDKLKYETFNKTFLNIYFTGILLFLIYIISHLIFIFRISGWGADSPIIQLMASFFIFVFVFIPTIYIRKYFSHRYWLVGIAFTVLSALWIVNAILFNSGLPPYDNL
jgi:hypothetical protein